MITQSRVAVPRSRWLAGILILVAMSWVPGNLAAQSAPRFDGETVFRGLFFGSGPVARLLPEICRLNGLPNHDPDAALTVDQSALLARLAERDPGFFDRFGSAMSSGDRLRIQESLRESAGALDSVLKVSEESQTAESIIKTHTGTVIGINTYGWIYRDTAIALVTDNVLFLIPIDPGQGGSGQDLRSEIFVDLLATRLAS